MLNIYKPSLVNALRADDEEIHNVLVVVLLTPELTSRALELKGLEAETLLDLLQSVSSDCHQTSFIAAHTSPKMLDKGFLFNILETETIRKTYNLIYRLSKACGIFPSSLMVEDVVNVETSAKKGGGYADVFRGSYQGKQVALKCLRIFLKGHDRHEAHKVAALVYQNIHPKLMSVLITTGNLPRSPSLEEGSAQICAPVLRDRRNLAFPFDMSPFAVDDQWNYQGLHGREQRFLPEAACE